MINEEERKNILTGFPEIKLSYDRNTHKTISADLYFIIPKGKKYIAWFTSYNRKNVCLLLELGYQKKIINIFFKHVSFDDSLCYGTYGTIFYGTLFNSNKNIENLNIHQYFSIENIHFYKGDNIDYYNLNKKLDLIKYIFTYKLSQKSFLSNGIVFGLPPIFTTYREASDLLIKDKLPYNVYSIQYRNLYETTKELYYTPVFTSENKNKLNNNEEIIIKNNFQESSLQTNVLIKNNKYTKNIINFENRNYIKIFTITPDIQNDIYYLKNESYNNENINNSLIAHIPDFKTSVMMNNLFRKIKENNNLDKLEESDDEEEFENINLDKFVDLNKSVKMKCFFNNKFKRWTPFEIL